MLLKTKKIALSKLALSLCLRNRQKYIQGCKKVVAQKGVWFLLFRRHVIHKSTILFRPSVIYHCTNWLSGKAAAAEAASVVPGYWAHNFVVTDKRGQSCRERQFNILSRLVIVTCFVFPVFLRLLPHITPGPFTETLTRSDETNISNKCNNTTPSSPKVTGGPKQAPLTKAKKPKKPVIDNNINMPTLLVKVKAEDRDTFYFDTKKLNCDSSVESCVKVMQQYI